MPEAQTDVSRDVPQFPVQAHASSSSTTSFSSSYTSQFLPGHVAHAFYSPTGTLLDTSAMSSRIPLTPSESPSVDSPEMDVSLPELDVPVEQYLPVQELIASYEQTKDLTDSSEKHSSQRNTNSSPVQSTPAFITLSIGAIFLAQCKKYRTVRGGRGATESHPAAF